MEETVDTYLRGNIIACYHKRLYGRKRVGDAQLKDTDKRLTELFSKDSILFEAFKCLFENSSDAIYILDKRGNLAAVNGKSEELTGFKREDFIGKSFRKIVSFKSICKAIRAFLDVIKGKEVQPRKSNRIHPNTSQRIRRGKNNGQKENLMVPLFL